MLDSVSENEPSDSMGVRLLTYEETVAAFEEAKAEVRACLIKHELEGAEDHADVVFKTLEELKTDLSSPLAGEAVQAAIFQVLIGEDVEHDSAIAAAMSAAIFSAYLDTCATAVKWVEAKFGEEASRELAVYFDDTPINGGSDG